MKRVFFGNLSLKKKHNTNIDLVGYKIFKDKDNFEIVQAQTLAEAIANSGINSPYKVERVGLNKEYIISEDKLVDVVTNDAKQSANEPAKAAEPTQAEQVPSAEQPAAQPAAVEAEAPAASENQDHVDMKV
jgi:hypothetical protein